MTKTMRTLHALAAVVILGTVVYAQEKPKTVDKKALPKGESDSGNLVRSLNMLQGDITLQPGTNVSITKAGNALTIAAANALTGVAHDNTLTGNGTAGSPLGVVSQNLVSSLNTLKGDLTLVAGTNVSITPSGNSLTIAAANVLTGVAHDSSLTGNGTPASPLGLTGIVHNNTLTGNGTAASPLGVVSQDNAVDAFWESSFGAFFGTEGFLNLSITAVPFGKQLIVQHVSMFCVMSGDEMSLAYINANQRSHSFEMRHVANSGSSRVWNTSQPLTLYLNSGTHLTLSASRSSTSGTGVCTASVSGRFVPVP